MGKWFHARAKKHSPRQKRRWALFPPCGLLRLVAERSLSPRVSLRKGRRRKMGRFDPGPFCLRRLLFCPGNEKMGVIDKLITHDWQSPTSHENGFKLFST